MTEQTDPDAADVLEAAAIDAQLDVVTFLAHALSSGPRSPALALMSIVNHFEYVQRELAQNRPIRISFPRVNTPNANLDEVIADFVKLRTQRDSAEGKSRAADI